MFRIPISRIDRSAALLLLGCLALNAAPRDYWLRIERNGTPFAWEHITVTDLPGGCIARDKLLRGRPRAAPDRDLHGRGPRRQPHDNRTTSERLSFDARTFYFDSVLEDVIARNAGRRRFRLRLLDLEKRNLETSRVEIQRVSTDGIEAVVQDSDWTTLYRLSRDGQVREMLIEKIGVRRHPAAAGDARNITALTDAFFPPVKSRNPIPKPSAVTWALPAAAAPSGPRRPSAQDLGEDHHVKPRDPTIRLQAAEVVGGAKDPSVVVRALLAWVNGYIRPEMRSDILTGPQVLQLRTGRCAEASLARAAGVPTRIVVGVAYHDGAWGGHM